jgi:hypothetical protein
VNAQVEVIGTLQTAYRALMDKYGIIILNCANVLVGLFSQAPRALFVAEVDFGIPAC